MTKKDYIILASVMKSSKPDMANYDGLNGHFDSQMSQYKNILENLCRALKAENPNFNKDKFIKFIGGTQ
jgi:polysaccharide deacetylase 2 family uncharacterized protein YibQ